MALRSISFLLLLTTLLVGCDEVPPVHERYGAREPAIYAGVERTRTDSIYHEYARLPVVIDYPYVKRVGMATDPIGMDAPVPQATVNGHPYTATRPADHYNNLELRWESPPGERFLKPLGEWNVFEMQPMEYLLPFRDSIRLPSLDADITFPRPGDSVRISSSMEITVARPPGHPPDVWEDLLVRINEDSASQTPYYLYISPDYHLGDSAHYTIIFDDMFLRDSRRYIYGPVHIHLQRSVYRMLPGSAYTEAISYLDVPIVFIP